MRILATAAAALLIAGPAFAQSAVSTPGQPGSGYKAPEAQATGAPVTSGTVPVPGRGESAPGAGYKIPGSPQTGAPMTSGVSTPGQPGSGYQAPEKKP